MKKLFGTALAAGAAMLGSAALPAASAHAEDIAVSGNIALTSDYVFRGISQTGEGPAVQGGFDTTLGDFYLGTWGSSLGQGAGASMEIDLYGGWKQTVGPVALDLGVLGYFYPDAHDSGAEFDYYELKAVGTVTPATNWTITGSLYWSPENYGETGDSLYLEIASAYTFNDKLSVSAAYGSQKIDDTNGPSATAPDDTYGTWNVGATYNVLGLGVDLRYIDTDIKSSDAIVTNGYTTVANTDGRVVLTVKKSL